MDKNIFNNLEKNNMNNIISIGSVLLLYFIAFGYFVYGGFDGVFGILLLCLLYSVSILLSFIPLFGFLIHGLVMYFVISPWVFDYTGLHDTWLTATIFWIYIILGAFITLGAVFLMHDKIK